MRLTNILSLTSSVSNWLANSRNPRILHVFDRACNLINERREVLSIVTPQIGNGPFNLVIPRLRKSFGLSDGNESWQTSEVFYDYIDLQSPISISPTQLHLGALTINIGNAELWNPCPDWERIHTERDKILNQLTSLSITNYQPLLPNSLFSNLSSALVNTDISTAKSIASKLSGLGIGLTPAGDDFMMGAMYATWIIHPFETAKVLAEEIANTAAPLTTSLSGAWLKSAGRGEAGILWHNFFDALVSTNIMNVQEFFQKILAVGETSGADAMSGFYDMIYYWAESIGVTRDTTL